MAKFLATFPLGKCFKKNPYQSFSHSAKNPFISPSNSPLLCKFGNSWPLFCTVPAPGLAKIPLISTPSALESSWKLILGCSFSGSAIYRLLYFLYKSSSFLFVFSAIRRRSFDHLVSKKCVVFALLFSKANKPRGWFYFE